MTQGFTNNTNLTASLFRLAQGRLTLTSNTPVTTSDVTAATTLYYTPFQGNQIALYSGAQWQTVTFTELSIAVPATTSTMYDVWAYLSSGVAVLELLAWTSDTARNTALATQDGIYIKSGDATRRYLGSFRTTAVSGQTEDSVAKRYVWNYYNRVIRSLYVTDSTTSWNYSTASWRQARGSSTNQVEAVIGVVEDEVHIIASVRINNSTATDRSAYVGVGNNVTNANSALGGTCVFRNTVYMNMTAMFNTYPSVTGRNFFAWIEQGAGADTNTWYGGSQNSGLSGFLRG